MNANDVIVKTGLHDIYIQIDDYDIVPLSEIGYRLYVWDTVDNHRKISIIKLGCQTIYTARNEEDAHKAFNAFKIKLFSSIRSGDIFCDFRPIIKELKSRNNEKPEPYKAESEAGQ